MPVSSPAWSSKIIGLHQKSFPGSIWWHGATSIYLGVCPTLFRGFGEEEPTVKMVGIIARVDLQSAEGSDWPQGRESFNALTTIQFVKKTLHKPLSCNTFAKTNIAGHPNVSLYWGVDILLYQPLSEDHYCWKRIRASFPQGKILGQVTTRIFYTLLN